jgi:hypothetical protein
MRQSRPWTDDSGSASLEFITVGMILLLPLVYLVLTVASVQAGSLAVEAASRHAARVFVQATDEGTAMASAERAARFALADHGFELGEAAITVSCSVTPCLTRREYVTISVDLSVALPLAPAVLQGAFPLQVPVRSTATQQVSRFWGAG